jgi:exopolyphosphatase/guanosine-5'-triphosphate,3'-diphosphate pyrophosphatase
MITAGIDIGTNTVRMIVADVIDGKISSIIHQNRSVTRLGEGFIKSGLLREDAIKRTFDSVVKFYYEALSYNPLKVKCCATSAVREAENGHIFTELLRDHGIQIEIIDGETEGRLTALGVMSGLNFRNKPSLIVDIGGGSTELIYWSGRDLDFAKSFKIGVVKLSDMFDFSKPSTEDLLDRVNLYIADFFSDFNFSIEIKNIIATAGTPTTLAAIDMQMENYDYRRVNGYIITKKRLNELISFISSKNIEERKMIKGLEPGREDLIVPGSLILMFLLDRFSKDQLIVSDFGLREGIAIAAAL